MTSSLGLVRGQNPDSSAPFLILFLDHFYNEILTGACVQAQMSASPQDDITFFVILSAAKDLSMGLGSDQTLPSSRSLTPGVTTNSLYSSVFF